MPYIISDKNLPRRKEVWSIDDKYVRFVEGKKSKKNRFVLVMMADDLCNEKNITYNIIPLSTQGNPDKLRIPIYRGYEDIIDKDAVDTNSLAVLNHYQPVKRTYLSDYIGRIDEQCYQMIAEVIKSELIGWIDFDIEI